jgi:hypothetical protein
MIHPLRTIHRNAFFCLGVLLPALLIAGILMRHERVEAGSGDARLPSGSVLTEQSVAFDGRKVAIDLYEVSREPVTVQFTQSEPLVAPDVLVYWSEVGSTAMLPSDAQLLGVFAPRTRYTLPLGGRVRGYVILYSAARQLLLGSFSYEGSP